MSSQPNPSTGGNPETGAENREARLARRIAMLSLTEHQLVGQRNRRLRRWLLHMPLALAILGFLWAAVAFLRLIAR